MEGNSFAEQVYIYNYGYYLLLSLKRLAKLNCARFDGLKIVKILCD